MILAAYSWPVQSLTQRRTTEKAPLGVTWGTEKEGEPISVPADIQHPATRPGPGQRDPQREGPTPNTSGPPLCASPTGPPPSAGWAQAPGDPAARLDRGPVGDPGALCRVQETPKCPPRTRPLGTDNRGRGAGRRGRGHWATKLEGWARAPLSPARQTPDAHSTGALEGAAGGGSLGSAGGPPPAGLGVQPATAVGSV